MSGGEGKREKILIRFHAQHEKPNVELDPTTLGSSPELKSVVRHSTYWAAQMPEQLVF